MAVRVLGPVFVLFIVTILLGWQLSFATLFDLKALVLVFAVVIGGLWWTFGPQMAIQAFLPPGTFNKPESIFRLRRHLKARRRGQSLSFGAGVIGLLFGVIAMFGSLEDPARLGESLALALIAPLYGSMLAWFVFSGTPRRAEP